MRYVCKNCGAVLYTSIGRSDNPPSPEYVASLYNYKGYASKSSLIRDALLKHLKKLHEEEGEGKRPDQGEN